MSVFGMAAFGLGYHVYADLPLSQSLRIPAATALLPGMLLLAGSWHRASSRTVVFFAVSAVIALSSILLNPAFWASPALQEFLPDYLLSLIVFAASALMALGILTASSGIRPDYVARGAGIAVLMILAGTGLELAGPLQQISEAFRQAVFPAALLYEENLRDVLIYGQIRAKLFTSEPSHVAKSFTLALLVWYAVSRSTIRIPLFYSALAAGVFLIKSPGILIVLPAVWICDIVRLRNSGWLIAYALAGMLIAPIALLTGFFLFEARIDHILSGQDGSFLIRLALPVQVWSEVWRDYPLFGLGFGAKESGVPYALSAGAAMGLDLDVLLTTTAPIGNNGLFIALVQMGALGSLLLAGTFCIYWRSVCGPYWVFAATALLTYLTTLGAINDPRFWGAFALITVAARAAYRQDIGASRPQPAPQHWPSPQAVHPIESRTPGHHPPRALR